MNKIERIVPLARIICWFFVVAVWRFLIPFFKAMLPAGIKIGLLSPVLPLLGNGSWALGSVLGVGSTWLLLHVGIGCYTLGIPTLLATLSYWSSRRASMVAGMVDFLMHVVLCALAVGVFAFYAPCAADRWYALFWVLPVIAYAVPRRSTFVAKLAAVVQATFVAHAAGSLIWLFCVPGKVASWAALMPVVAAERALMIVISFAALYAIEYAALLLTSVVVGFVYACTTRKS